MSRSKLDYNSDYDDDNYYKRYKCKDYSPEPKIIKFEPKANIYDMQKERLKLFKAQDVEKGSFDITFDFGGKKLHVHKIMLTTSEPLMSLISDRWYAAANNDDKDGKEDKSVKIETYSYDNFYQFLCFLYSGECKLTQENILTLTDMAEFFVVPVLKGYCVQWLTDNKYNINEKNIYDFVEIAQRYSLTDFMDEIRRLFNRNLGILVKDEMFLTVKKEVMEALSKFKKNEEIEQEFFEGAFKWAEHRAKAAAEPDDKNLQEVIKNDLNGILPNIDFSLVLLRFVISFVIPDKCYLFEPAELYKILLKSCRYNNKEEEDFFKTAYELAEKEAIKKQQTSNDDINDVIKAELAEILPQVKFHLMTEKFLTDFVVAKGILSRVVGLHAHDITIEIKNANKTLVGTFKDDFKFYDHVHNHDGCRIKHKCETKQKFNKLHFRIPTTPSTVSKMKGSEWYLCLEKDGILNLKFHTKISSCDYLIAVLTPKDNTGFHIDLDSPSYITVTRNKVI